MQNQLVKTLYCKLPGNGKQLPAFPLDVRPGFNLRSQVRGECVTTAPLWPPRESFDVFIYLFGVSHRFQHCTGHITTDSWKGRGNQYIQLVKVLYCKLPTNGKQLPAFPLEAVPGMEPRSQRWEARVLPLCHRGP